MIVPKKFEIDCRLKDFIIFITLLVLYTIMFLTFLTNVLNFYVLRKQKTDVSTKTNPTVFTKRAGLYLRWSYHQHVFALSHVANTNLNIHY